jgi:hypothetical protein
VVAAGAATNAGSDDLVGSIAGAPASPPSVTDSMPSVTVARSRSWRDNHRRRGRRHDHRRGRHNHRGPAGIPAPAMPALTPARRLLNGRDAVGRGTN